MTADDIIQKFGRPDVIWASPDCATFSIAAISHHRRKNPETGNLDPISDYAKFCDEVDQHVLLLIKELNPIFYFIENPRGGMRKMTWMQNLPRYTVTYCQYGDKRMKPTDIWTNHPDPQFKPMCKNGDPCHEKAPRGSRTGTQGLNGSKERSVIPAQLCNHIVDICEKYLEEKENSMELKMNEYQLPDKISFNFEELKQELASKVSMYETIVYTDEQIKDAKADKANLNKLKKALNDERIKREKEYMQPFNEFKAQVNEIISIIDKPIAVIDAQVKGYEEKQKQDKHEAIQAYWESIDKPEGMVLDRFFDTKWLNASASMKSIKTAIDDSVIKFKADMDTLSDLPEYSFEAQQMYISTVDIRKSLDEAHRLSDVAKKKAEHEAELSQQKQNAKMAQFMTAPVEEDHVEGQMDISAFIPEEESESFENFIPTFAEPERNWLVIKANVTDAEKHKIERFMTDNNIEFKYL